MATDSPSDGRPAGEQRPGAHASGAVSPEAPPAEAPPAGTPAPDGELDTLLEYVHERRNFDFRGYKRASLVRRVSKRMQAVGADTYQRYMDVLEANPSEFGELFNTILINVTAFLRDPDAWEVVSSVVLPEIVASKAPGDPIRVWSAGCASGEEAYTLAVLLAEALGEDRFRRDVKVYATDADTGALVAARHGRYPEKDLVAAFGEPRTRRFFDVDSGHGVFRPDLRRSLIFGRHDLVQDPPISKVDLLVCRNTLMYFTAELQQLVLTSFHFALNPDGYLFLGKAEALATRLRLFEPVDARQHIFRRNAQRPAGLPPVPAAGRTRLEPAAPSRLAEAMVEQGSVPQVVVDAQARVLLANPAARRLFSIGSSEIGWPLEAGDLAFEKGQLQRLVDQTYRERRAVTVPDVAYVGRSAEPTSFDVVLSPLEGHLGVAVSLHDVSRYRVLAEDLERSQRELESAYEELQSAVEELETTNEELQSTNEELETTNEELHSTNEELETMNEELQSTNEELETINNELRARSAEVDELNTFLQTILASLRSAVVVLGTEMEVRAWNRQAEDLWGLRSEEVLDQHFLNLDIGFPVETLGHAIRACLAGRADGVQVTQPAVNRRGRRVEVTVTVNRLMAQENPRGVILLMDAVPDPTAPAG